MRLPNPKEVFPDYYAELGVPSGASLAEIRASYRNLARASQRDLGGPSDDPQRRAFIDRAYRVLSDRRRRAAYDFLCRVQFGSFILLLVKPTAHPRGRTFLFLVAVLALLLLISLATLHWDIAMYVLGLGSAVLALSKALLDWLVPLPGTTRLPVDDNGA